MVRMDQRVTFQEVSRTSDGGGGTTVTWADLATDSTVYARVRAKSGRERMDEDRPSASAGYEITIRNRGDIDETMRMVWLGESYNIRNVMREGPRPLYLHFDADRGVAGLS